MNWLQNYRKSALIVGMTLALPLLLVVTLIGDFWVMRQDSQREIERLEPRIARLAGLLESEAQLQVAAGRVDSTVVSLVYPQSDVLATVSAALQSNVREIMVEAGLTVSNSQILPVVNKDGYDRIGLKLTVAGGLASLDAALSELMLYSPLLLIESIEVWPARTVRKKNKPAEQKITASLQLLTLRVTP